MTRPESYRETNTEVCANCKYLMNAFTKWCQFEKPSPMIDVKYFEENKVKYEGTCDKFEEKT